MKKILGYGVFCLISLFCVYCMALRTESLENKTVNTMDNNSNVYALNNNN